MRAAERALEDRRRARARPSAPMPIEVIVTPICTAEMYSLTFASCSSASAAPLAPSSRISSRRARRERTSAYSAITKNALIAISSAARMSFRPFTRVPAIPDARRRPACGPDAATVGAGGPSRATLLRGRSSSSSFIVLSTRSTVARAMVGREAGALRSGEARRSRAASAKSASVRPPCGVRGERQAHLVPAVHEDVRVVVGAPPRARRRG